MESGRVSAEEVVTRDTATSSKRIPYSLATIADIPNSFERRFRIYELKDYGETIETYKRTESGHVIDRQVLVG
jgi:hypothetical protein